MKKFLLLLFLVVTTSAYGLGYQQFPQDISIGATGKPDASAQLDVNSITKGMLPPRMTTVQKDAIVAPAEGLIIYDTDLFALQVYNAGNWTAPGGNGIDHPLWTASTIYGVGFVIIDDVGGFNVYRANTLHTSDATLFANDLANWDELSSHNDRLLQLPTTTAENTVQSDTNDITPLLVKGKTISVTGIPVIWTNAVNVSVVSNLVTKTGGGSGWNAGAFSTQPFVASTLSHVEWTILDTTKLFIMGLSATDPDQDRATVEFGIYSVGTTAQVWESGGIKYVFGPHIVGDTYSVGVTVINTIEYRKNGVLGYTSILTPTLPLYVDSAFHTVGGSAAPTITNSGMVQTENIFEVQSDSGDSHFSIAPFGSTVIEELHIKDDAGGEYVGFTAPATVASSTLYTLPDADGTSGQVLSTNGSLVLDWTNPLNSWFTATSYVIGNVVYESNKLYLALTNHTSGTFATDLGANDWVELSDDLNRETSVTDNALVAWDGTGGDNVKDTSILVSGGVSLSGITDLTYGGNLTTPLTANRALITNGTSIISASTVTDTELGYVSGVTSAIQTQLAAKLTNVLTSANIFVGSGVNVATGVAVTGDISITNAGVTAYDPLSIVDGDIAAAANITATKLGTGVVDNTELNLLNGRTYIPNTVGVDNQISTFNGVNSIDSSANLTFDGSILSLTGTANLLTENELRFQDAAGGEYMGFKAPTTLTASQTFTLPDGDGTANQVLETNGSGVLSWVAAAAKVISDALGILRIESCEFTVSGSIVTANDNCDNWLGALTWASAGANSAVISPAFSHEPVCIITAIGGDRCVTINTKTASSFATLGRTCSTGGATDASYNIFCMGLD